MPGPTSTEVARIKAPSSVRAQFGTDCTRNACHGSDSHEAARLVTNYFRFWWDAVLHPYHALQDILTLCLVELSKSTFLIFYCYRLLELCRGRPDGGQTFVCNTLRLCCKPELLTPWFSVSSQETCFFFFNRKLGICARFCHCSVAIVKPHAVTAGDISCAPSVVPTGPIYHTPSWQTRAEMCDKIKLLNHLR